MGTALRRPRRASEGGGIGAGGTGWEMLSHLFAPDAPVLHVHAAAPSEGQLRRAAALLVLDPKDRGAAQLTALGFTYVRDFAVLPDPAAPRWLIPIDDRRVASGAFAIHTPYGRIARTTHAIARLAARTGAPIWYRHRLRLAARGMPPVESWINDVCGPDVRLAFARGAPRARPKPTLVALDRAARPVAYGKLAREPLRRSAVSREAQALVALASDPRTIGIGPRLLGEAEMNGTYLTLQEPIAGRVGRAALGPPHAAFLDALIGEGARRPVASCEFVQALRQRASGSDASLLTRLVEMLALTELPVVITHGDFAPWNLRLDEGSLRAFDWEWWCGDSLPIIDGLHHELQVSFLIGRRDARQAALLLARRAAARPFGLAERETYAIYALGILDYVLRIAEDGYGDTALARRYRELLGFAASAAGP